MKKVVYRKMQVNVQKIKKVMTKKENGMYKN